MNTQPQDHHDRPDVPVGLSTVVGLVAATAAALVAALAAILDGDHSPETIGAMVSGAIVLYSVIRSRGAQAAALSAPTTSPTMIVNQARPLLDAAAIETATAELAERIAGERDARAAADAPDDIADQRELAHVDGDLPVDDIPTETDRVVGPVDVEPDGPVR